MASMVFSDLLGENGWFWDPYSEQVGQCPKIWCVLWSSWLTSWRAPSCHRTRKCGSWCVLPSGQHCLSLAQARRTGSEFLRWSLKLGTPTGTRKTYETMLTHRADMIFRGGRGLEGGRHEMQDKEQCIYNLNGWPLCLPIRLTSYTSPLELRTFPLLILLALCVCVYMCVCCLAYVYKHTRL